MKKSIWIKRIGNIFGNTFEDFMAENEVKSGEEFERTLMDNSQEIMGKLMDEFGLSVDEFNTIRDC